jgi:hypothetical protein
MYAPLCKYCIIGLHGLSSKVKNLVRKEIVNPFAELAPEVHKLA